MLMYFIHWRLAQVADKGSCFCCEVEPKDVKRLEILWKSTTSSICFVFFLRFLQILITIVQLTFYLSDVNVAFLGESSPISTFFSAFSVASESLLSSFTFFNLLRLFKFLRFPSLPIHNENWLVITYLFGQSLPLFVEMLSVPSFFDFLLVSYHFPLLFITLYNYK